MKLSTQIVSTNLTTVIVLSVALYLGARFTLSSNLDKYTGEELSATAECVQSDVKQLEQKTLEVASVLAARPDVVQALVEPNPPVLQKLGQEMAKGFNMDAVTFADKSGVVIARGHDSAAGDNVAAQPNVRKALAGQAASTIEEPAAGKFTLQTGYPIRNGTTVVGVVTVGTDLTANNRLVDSLKKKYRLECTIFQKDTRVSTTIERDGKRLVGTRMDNPTVIETVLTKGQSFAQPNTIQGKPYDTAYWPLRGSEGEVLGMWFLGREKAVTAKIVAHMSGMMGLVILVMASASAVAAVFVARSLAKRVHRVAVSLSEGASQVTGSAQHMAQTSEALAEGAAEQASSLEETSASLEEMSSMTQRSAENAGKASELARAARTAADGGVTDMEAMSRAIGEIKDSSDDISQIIKTIDQIAFQTNILALNAAVEAARAGEAGMGFAVVADEVRSLAQRSAQAAKETASKIEGAMSKTAQGVEISQKVLSILQQIVERIRQVDQLVAEVAEASKQQNQGIGQLNTAVSQIDKVVQLQAAKSTESSDVAGELRSEARDLQAAVSTLLEIVGGRDAAVVAASTKTNGTASHHPMPAEHAAMGKSLEPKAKIAPELKAPIHPRSSTSAPVHGEIATARGVGDSFKDF